MFGSWPDIGNDRSNEYLRKIQTAQEVSREDLDVWTAREALTRAYSWAIPTQEAVSEICTQCRAWRALHVVSIGAGTGFWEHLIQVELSGEGLVHAWDSDPPFLGCNSFHPGGRHWHHILEGDPADPTEELRHHLAREDSTLFLSWPPYAKPMAADSLRLFGGKLVVYIGEGEGGCTADGDFHRMLRQDWQRISHAEIPQWPGIHDWLSIWLRR